MRGFESLLLRHEKDLNFDEKLRSFSMMFALRQMMTLSLMMFPSEMMSASPNVFGKHRIIANEMSNIIFARQMHHIARGDASLKCTEFCDTISTINKNFRVCIFTLGVVLLVGSIILVPDKIKKK